ncbi:MULTISPECIES: hypothetical protein [Thermoprotei]
MDEPITLVADWRTEAKLFIIDLIVMLILAIVLITKRKRKPPS